MIYYRDNPRVQMFYFLNKNNGKTTIPISLATVCNFDSVLLISTILMPKAASWRAYSLPMPSVAPVTTESKNNIKDLG